MISVKTGKDCPHLLQCVFHLDFIPTDVEQSLPIKRKGTQWHGQHPTISLTYKYTDGIWFVCDIKRIFIVQGEVLVNLQTLLSLPRYVFVKFHPQENVFLGSLVLSTLLHFYRPCTSPTSHNNDLLIGLLSPLGSFAKQFNTAWVNF